MRRTRNQRRRDLFETVATLIAIVLLTYLIVFNRRDLE